MAGHENNDISNLIAGKKCTNEMNTKMNKFGLVRQSESNTNDCSGKYGITHFDSVHFAFSIKQRCVTFFAEYKTDFYDIGGSGVLFIGLMQPRLN